MYRFLKIFISIKNLIHPFMPKTKQFFLCVCLCATTGLFSIIYLTSQRTPLSNQTENRQDLSFHNSSTGPATDSLIEEVNISIGDSIFDNTTGIGVEHFAFDHDEQSDDQSIFAFQQWLEDFSKLSCLHEEIIAETETSPFFS